MNRNFIASSMIPTKPFSIDYFIQLLKNGFEFDEFIKFNESIEKAIHYYNQYWYRKISDGEFLLYDVGEMDFITANPDKGMWKKVQVILKSTVKLPPVLFQKIRDKFIQHEPHYTVRWIPNCSERIVVEGTECKTYTINLSTRWKYNLYEIETDPKELDIMLQNNQEAFDLWMEFHLNVISGGDINMHEYLLKWEANIYKGVRNTSVLYMKGNQGIGKSTYTDMMMKHMFRHGEAKTVKSSALLTGFNGELYGTQLAVFEELPSTSKSEWEKIESNLKDFCTNDTMVIRKLYKEPICVENMTNIIINTNTNPLAHANGRRIVIPDISEHRQGDYEYFGRIRNLCFNDEFADFYRSYIIANYFDKKFNPQCIPRTVKKQDAFFKTHEKAKSDNLLDECILGRRAR